MSFVRCEPKDHPVGNLRPVENVDAGQIEPVGNLRPVEIDTGAPTPDSGTAAPADAGAPAKDAGAAKDSGAPKPPPTQHPVGNLRPPG